MSIYVKTKAGTWTYWCDTNDLTTLHGILCDLATRGIEARWSNQYLGSTPKMVG